MPQYLVAGYLPDDFDPSQADEATGREIHALNKEMIAAGVRKFACGLGSAKSLRAQTDGGVLVTVRSAMPDWPAAEAILRSLRILTRHGTAPANDDGELLTLLPVVTRSPRDP